MDFKIGSLDIDYLPETKSNILICEQNFQVVLGYYKTN